MATYTIEYTLTERTVQRVDIIAGTPEEAQHLAEGYEFDNSEAWEVGPLEWSISEVRAVE